MTAIETKANATLIRKAFRLEGFTIAWMTVEAAVAIGAGIAAHSLLLLAFGIDSVIELTSACVLIWRLSVELRHGQAFSEMAERRASRMAGGLLFALAVYVFLAAAVGFARQRGAEFSAPGIILTMTAIPIMYFLARRKLAVILRRRMGQSRSWTDLVDPWRVRWVGVWGCGKGLFVVMLSRSVYVTQTEMT